MTTVHEGALEGDLVLGALGGMGTILAVALVCAFLIWVVAPLFLPASIDQRHDLAVPGASASDVEAGSAEKATKAPWQLSIDEHQMLGYTIDPDGSLRVFRADNGKLVEQREFLKAEGLTAAAFSMNRRGELPPASF